MIDCALGVAETVEWPTPPEFFAVVDAEFHFNLDVCATAENAKCAKFYTLKENGLAQPWTGMVWMNPPYGSEIPRWLRKAYDVACAGEATVACLIPARTDTLWFHEFCAAGEIRFLKGRLTFIGSEWPAPFPSMLVVFHAHLDPGGVMKAWDWKGDIAARESSQNSLNFAAGAQ